MSSFRFLLMMNAFCFKNHPFSNKLALCSLNEDTIEISATRCLSICQFKIGQGEKRTREKNGLPFPPTLTETRKKDTARGGTKMVKWWEWKSCSVRSRRTRELDQSGSWVSGREALLIPEDLPRSFCVRDLNSGWRCGWSCGLIYLQPLLTQPR